MARHCYLTLVVFYEINGFAVFRHGLIRESEKAFNTTRILQTWAQKWVYKGNSACPAKITKSASEPVKISISESDHLQATAEKFSFLCQP
jgi:hypothetical protein